MQCIRKSLLVPHSAERMFNLVDGVEDYPKFLPWCGGVEVHEHTDTILDVTVRIEFMKVKTFFRTRDEKTPFTQIDMQFVDGPFKALHGLWTFTALDEDACKIEFALDYEFSNRMLEAVIGPVFARITNTFVDAFIARADKLYD
ncbi:ribosome-associated toxin RatA of RatAB toxin-antitoxin module [Silvimonas terrae]|uniref:Ribosome-associated toxin RatA of RatAB toxin-antitoxin module n=1 Tax=Silvimonas terrae TaxID=300266 RepID=A0A840RAR3_9NEIS|nr:type II toxin-antitoxin system RatA family toxin [Silvimonas terrae]MBB5190499.1 ribosome-associated toxin RatA of RatAB toxin-antitoxin module [Silvimonas terrae]